MSAVPTDKPQKKDFRYYSLDFWRGVACLSVAAFHSIDYITENPAHTPGTALTHKLFVALAQGWAGVPLFFVISGYCIAAACEGAMAKGMSTKTYFFRRFRRIYPPYWIMLLLFIGMHYGFTIITGADYLADSILPMTKPWVMTAHQWLGSFTLTEGWRDHLFGPPSRYFLVTAWSLGFEEQFYFVCGMAMLFGRERFYKIMVWLSVAVAITTFVNFAIVKLPIEGFFFDGRWLMFAAGVLVFHVLHFGTDRSRKFAMGLMAVGACIAVTWDLVHHVQMARHFVVSFLFGIALILLFKRDRQIAESRILRPVTLCGVMCYSLYLVHAPIVKAVSQFCYRSGITGEWSTLFISVPACVLTSVLFAWVFFNLVERRFLNTPPSLPKKKTEAPQPEVPAAVNA